VRALRDALWHNSLSVADAVGLAVDAMQVDVTIGVPRPDLVDNRAVLAVLPHGTGTASVVHGGLEIPNDAGTNTTVIANAAAVVRLEMGAGNDLHGGDYTKAAVRAVQDAIHHSSLALIRTLGLDSRSMRVEVTIGVQRPEEVDAELVKSALPHGEVVVNVVKGGLDVPDEEAGEVAVIATAAVAVRLDLPQAR
jgi:uncharacterized protein (TIGR02058 family)